MKTNRTPAVQYEAACVPLGPRQRITRPAGDWAIVAEEMMEVGSARRWDVYALHKKGARVPPGLNPHGEPTLELARLDAVINWASEFIS